MKKKKFNTPRFILLTTAILIAATTRLLPHPPNFTPIVAMALFGGACYGRRIWSFAVPVAAMLFSDFLLMHFVYPGYRPGYFTSFSTLSVYASLLLIIGIGLSLYRRMKILPVVLATLGSSLLFFLITNFGVWVSIPMYPMNISGLLACYAAAIPFFINGLLGDMLFSGILFTGFYLLQLRYPVLAGSKTS